MPHTGSLVCCFAETACVLSAILTLYFALFGGVYPFFKMTLKRNIICNPSLDAFLQIENRVLAVFHHSYHHICGTANVHIVFCYQ